VTAETTVAFVGFHGTGKTTYLGALWMIIQDPRDTTMTEVEVRGDRSHLQSIGEQVARAERLLRTKVESDDGFAVTLEFSDGATAALNIPDLSGEGVRLLVEDRVWHPQLSDAVQDADALILFVSPRPLKLPIRSSFTDEVLAEFLAQDAGFDEDEEGSGPGFQPQNGSVGASLLVDDEQQAQGAAPSRVAPAAEEAADPEAATRPTEVEFEARYACTSARIVDALENVLALRADSRPLRVGIVVSAWDSVDPSLTPAQWVQERLPALTSFIEVNSDRMIADVFGISAQGGRLPQQKDELLAKGDVIDRVFARDRSGDPVALAQPLRWTMGI